MNLDDEKFGVYTNGDMFDVTKDVTAKTAGENSGTSRPQLGTYYAIKVGDGGASVEFKYVGVEFTQSFAFTYLNEGSAGYDDFHENELYAKLTDTETNTSYYEYVYWDTRYKRNDTITNSDGKIMDFVNGAPTCKEVFNGVVGGGENGDD